LAEKKKMLINLNTKVFLLTLFRFMKKNIVIMCLFVFGLTFAQTKNFVINWQGTKILNTDTTVLELPAFNADAFSFDEEQGLQFIAQWQIFTAVNTNSYSITNVTYAPISDRELLDLDRSKIKPNLYHSLKNSKARDSRFAYLTVNPIVKSGNGTYKKVTSFSIKYNHNTRNAVSSRRSAKRLSATLSSSVLRSGQWFRFVIDTTGVFVLTKDFLESLGVPTNGLDPRTIRIYGNGGDMIPFGNDVPQPFDVQENAIKVIGQEDGVFNDQDVVLFYGVGPRGFNEESITHINAYTDETFYYVNIGLGPGKRIQALNQPTGAVTQQITTFQDYQFFEEDLNNLGTIGRRWFGRRFGIGNEQLLNFNFPDVVTTVPVRFRVLGASISSTRTSMNVNVNNETVTALPFGTTTGTIVGAGSGFTGDINVTGPDIAVRLNFNNGGNPSAEGYLDFVSIEATRALNFQNRQFQFKNNSVVNNSGIAEYVIENSSRLSEVWDVTDIFNVTSALNTDNTARFSFRANMGEERTYVAVSPLNYFTPRRDGNAIVSNQDLKGTIFNNSEGRFEDIDYLIVAPNNMLNQANRLAQINRDQYSLNVKVVGLNQIYNEFSTGNQDIGAIRNFVKYIYDNASSPEQRLKYLCLFGDGSYDYKERLPNNTNIIPSWHSYPSFSLTNSFVSDDFFGMMDEDEGTMANSDRLDIAVGRILADSPQRANLLVDKVEQYYAREAFGSWRNNYVVMSDDVDQDWEGVIQGTTDEIADEVAENRNFINVIKIHSDAFEQQSSPGGDTYPEAVEEFTNSINNGALVVNYFGHGGEEGLAEERLLTLPTIDDFRNVFRQNCFVTVTCEYTKFDNPLRQTAGEFTYWREDAGASSLITTTRQVFVTFGIDFNRALGRYLFNFADSSNQDEIPSIAESLRLTKVDPLISRGRQRRLVFYIGDPAMRLPFPKPNIHLTRINDVPVAQATDTLKALSKVKLSGEVRGANGARLTSYNGTLSTTIYDKSENRRTLANDNTRLRGELILLDFETLGSVIFRGQASVTNGEFDVEFVVPRDIRIPVGTGRVSFYATDQQLLQDQTGSDIANVRIGGVNENAETDDVGPVVSIFLNDENFVSGGITNEAPTLVVRLEDPNGINTVGGIGHDIVAVLDGDETNPFVLNDFYETNLDDFTRGTATFPLRDLEPGLHTLTVTAWDVFNNSSSSEIQFTVFNENQELVINNVLNYPNPFVDYTEFWFNHNSSEALDISVQIFTVSGKLVRTLNGQTTAGVSTTSSLSRDIVWDGRDDFGERIGKGVYIYKLTVRSNALNKKVEKIEKLVIL
jgi:hypothetical protein